MKKKTKIMDGGQANRVGFRYALIILKEGEGKKRDTILNQNNTKSLYFPLGFYSLTTPTDKIFKR